MESRYGKYTDASLAKPLLACWQNDFINGYHLVSKVQDDTKLFHDLSAKSEIILRLTIFVEFNHIRHHMVLFAISIFEEVELHLGFTPCLEDPIQTIPRLWNQPF
jgi:hypothetical protein